MISYVSADALREVRSSTGVVVEKLTGLRQGEYANVVRSQASLHPVLVTRDLREELNTGGATLLELLCRTVLGEGTRCSAALSGLGADPAAYPLLDDLPLQHHYATSIARPDAVLGRDGLRFLEFNVGSGIGGVVDTELHLRIWERCFPSGALEGGERPLRARAEHIRDVLAELALPPRLAVVGDRRDYGVAWESYFGVQGSIIGASQPTATRRPSSIAAVIGGSISIGVLPPTGDCGLPPVTIAAAHANLPRTEPTSTATTRQGSIGHHAHPLTTVEGRQPRGELALPSGVDTSFTNAAARYADCVQGCVC